MSVVLCFPIIELAMGKTGGLHLFFVLSQFFKRVISELCTQDFSIFKKYRTEK